MFQGVDNLIGSAGRLDVFDFERLHEGDSAGAPRHMSSAWR
jgi:hypothetical protein